MRPEQLKKIKHFAFRQFPRPFDLEVAKVGSGLVGAEIGVFEGKHAKFTCGFLKPALLSLVDPYEPYGDKTADMLAKAYKHATELLQTDIMERKVEFLNRKSHEAASEFSDHSLDFVYIDGNHIHSAVKQDIEAWWPKVRIGGILGGHDFHYKFTDVIRAVTEFSVSKGLILNVESPDWWIVV